MDSQKRDESRDRRREEALARRMGDALDRLDHHGAGECPDAELIAAYHERSFQPDEIARWEGHFAICGRCRKILAVLAATAEEPLAEKEVAHLGELIAATRAPAEAAARPIEITHPNRLAWRMRWLAPALGVAAVLVVWVAMRPSWRTADQSPSGTLIAQAPKSEPPPNTETRAVQQFSKATPKKETETDAETLKDRPAARPQSTNQPADALAENRLDAGRALGRLEQNSGVVENGLRDQKKEQGESSGAQAGRTSGGAFDAASPASPSPAPPALPEKPPEAFPRPQAQAQITRQAPSVTETPHSTNQNVVATEEAPVARLPDPLPQEQSKARATSQAPPVTGTPGSVSQTVTATEAAPQVEARNNALGGAVSNSKNLPLNGRDYQALLKLDPTGVIAVQVKTPTGKILWRAGKGGNIRRSADAGRTWILQNSPSQEDWLAGTAISDKVSWMVGRNGAIARTTDGGHWEKIAPPSVAADSSGKFPDWIGITAAGAQQATITASDQRHYATQDGGKTWKAQ
jgi:Photosynthesis system II assembly factor YCF48